VGKFFFGVLTTVVGGALLALLSPAIQRWANANDHRITVTDMNTFFVSDAVRQSLSKKDGSHWFHFVTLMNTGNEDLADVSATITGNDGSPLIDAGDVVALDDAERPKTKLESGKLTLTYALFKKGEITAFWIRTGSRERPSARASQKGVTINFPEGIDDSFPWDIMFVAVSSILLGILGGLLLAEMFNRHMLRKIGFDPKEIGEMYVEAAKRKA
jgi:hypothetical protein